MTRKEDHLERSRQRAEEYQRRRRMRVRLFIVAVALYVIVPLLWYGAVEFGLVHPIRTPEFRDTAKTAHWVALVIALYFLSDVLPRDSHQKMQKPKAGDTTTSE